MKKYQMLAVAVSVALSVFSMGVIAQTSSEDKRTCKLMSELAGAAMMARQNGASMARLMEEDLKAMQAIWEMMVEEAFRTARFSSEEYKKRAEEDFANQWYLRCIKAKR